MIYQIRTLFKRLKIVIYTKKKVLNNVVNKIKKMNITNNKTNSKIKLQKI